MRDARLACGSLSCVVFDGLILRPVSTYTCVEVFREVGGMMRDAMTNLLARIAGNAHTYAP